MHKVLEMLREEFRTAMILSGIYVSNQSIAIYDGCYGNNNKRNCIDDVTTAIRFF